MTSITRFSLKNAAVIIIIMLSILIGGFFSYNQLDMEEYPKVDIPYIDVSIIYPGATPEQVMNDIGRPLEKELGKTKELKNIFNFSSSSYLRITMEMSYSANMDETIKDVREKINNISMPEGAQKATVEMQSATAPYIYSFSISNPKASVEEVEKYVNNTLKPELEMVDKVSDVVVGGISDKGIYVEIDQKKLQDKQIPLDQLKQLLVANNLSMPIGSMTVSDKTMVVQAGVQYSSLDDVRNVILRSGPNAAGKTEIVRVSDVATVSYKIGADDQNQSISRINGESAVIINIKPQPSANVVKIVDDINAKFEDLQVESKGYTITTLRDQSVVVEGSVESMVHEAGYGGLFAVIITLLFLRNLRATLVAIVSIPISIFAAVILLKWTGFTLNIMTLSGMAVAVGRVVDDSIVVIENIYRRLHAAKDRDTKLVEESTREVGSAITSSTVTTIAVFLPMTMVPGIVGRFFSPFAWTVIFALLFSLLVAVTVVPLIAKFTLLKKVPAEEKEGGLQRGYRRMLDWSLRHKFIVLLVSVLLLAESGFALTKLDFNFLPTPEQKYYSIAIDMPVGSSIDNNNKIAKEVEQLLAKRDNIAHYSTTVTQMGSTMAIELEKGLADPTEFEKQLRDDLDKVKGAKMISLAGTGGVANSNEYFLAIHAPDSQSLKEAGQKLTDALKTVPGMVNVKSSAQDAKPRVEVIVDNEKAMNKMVNPVQVMGTVRDLLTGDTVSEVYLDGTKTDLKIQVKPDSATKGIVASTDELAKQTVTNMAGQAVPLRDIATVKVNDGPATVQHMNQKDFISITGTIIDSNASGVAAAAQAKIDALDLPAGVKLKQNGAAEAMSEGFTNLGVAMGVSIVLVLIVMLMTYGEMTAPLAILFSLPFAIIGGFNGLWLTDTPLGIPGMIGFLMLIGIVVTNAIVLMDRVEQNKSRGMSVREALLEAGPIRLRPILMTATATIAALLPLAFSTGAGVISTSLAIVVIGGLTTSTLLTLVIVPIMYEILIGIRTKLFSRSSAKSAKGLTVKESVN